MTTKKSTIIAVLVLRLSRGPVNVASFRGEFGIDERAWRRYRETLRGAGIETSECGPHPTRTIKIKEPANA